MMCESLRWLMTRAEDRATLGSDPSADPGAKTGGRAADPRVDRLPFPHPSGIGTHALNPSRLSRESSMLVVTLSAVVLHFRLNQDN
jgi:hypothetical protein